MVAIGMRVGFQVMVQKNQPELGNMHIADFRQLQGNSTARSLAIKDIGMACKTLGCFQVINHGINKSVLDGALEAAMEFFNLTAEEKAQFASTDVSKPVRYGVRSKDGISKARDLLKLYAHPLNDWIHLWPLTPNDYREKMGNYVTETRLVAMQLMDAIVESLGLNPANMRDQFDNGMQVTATNFYPQSSDPNLEVGIDSHTDYGFITILHQSCQGLQIKDQQNTWRAVPLLPEALHVQIGNYMEVLSNGRYKSVVHRAVLDPKKTRVSIASIHNLSMGEKVYPAKEMVDEQNPKGYKESSFRDFLNYLSTSDCRENRSYIDDLKI